MYPDICQLCTPVVPGRVFFLEYWAFYLIAGVGYLIDPLVLILFPTSDVTISQFTFVGELLLSLWLLFQGVNVEQWEKWHRTSRSA